MLEYEIAFLDATLSAISDEFKDPSFKLWLIWVGIDILSVIALNFLS